MNQITAKIDGMMCSMCEAHISDTIRKALPQAKKVKASRRSGEATFLLEGALDQDRLARAIADTGYTLRALSTEPYAKRGLFGK